MGDDEDAGDEGTNGWEKIPGLAARGGTTGFCGSTGDDAGAGEVTAAWVRAGGAGGRVPAVVDKERSLSDASA